MRPATGAAAPPGGSAATGQSITLVAQSSTAVWNATLLLPDRRILVAMPRLANRSGPSIALVGRDGVLTPYPDAGWNEPPPSGQAPAGAAASGPGERFVDVNALHLGPDGMIWVVDTGTPGFDRPRIAQGARLIRIDPASNRVRSVLVVPDAVLRPKSMIGDIRFNGGHAYIADAGAPGLLVLDLASGQIRRVLDQAPGLTAGRPVTVGGQTLRGADNKPVLIHADRLEVTPDGKALLVQPLCGPMSRIRTALLDDPKASPGSVQAGLTFWYDTPSVGGTAMLPDGTLLLNDLEDSSILALSSDRVMTKLVADERLHWADTPFLAPDGRLLVPVPQLDRAAPFHHEQPRIRFPVGLYAVDIPALLRMAAANAAAAPTGRP